MPQSNEARKFNRGQRDEMLIRQEYMCGGCGESMWRKPSYLRQAHHIVPYFAGGATRVENGVILCPTCHVSADNLNIIGTIYNGNGGTPIETADPSMIASQHTHSIALQKIANNRSNPDLVRKIRGT